ncbi:MAG: MFS transporter [Lachnospiraceae bacterium]|nr:MFS transporter [Lachnospiraceae bacterium]
MDREKRTQRIYILVTLIVAVLAVCFIALMGYLNYKTTVLELKEQVITRIEADTVDGMETALRFGKRIDNYYGTDEVFAAFRKQIQETVPFVMGTNGKLLYSDSKNTPEEDGKIVAFLQSTEFAKALENGLGSEALKLGSGSDRAILYPISQDEEIAGYFAVVYAREGFKNELISVRDRIISQTVLVAVILAIILLIFLLVMGSKAWKQKRQQGNPQALRNAIVLIFISLAIVILSGLSIMDYQADYTEKIKTATRISLQNLENTISRVSDAGVDIRDSEGLEEYIRTRVDSLDTLRSVRISQRIAEVERTDEASDLISFVFNTGMSDGVQTYMYLEAEISEAAMNRQIKSIVLTLISTLIILLMFVFESTKVIELITGGGEDNKAFSERKVSLALRLTGFLCSTAEYMCVPYAAMMIRESGETLFGLSNGVTSALPLTMEGFAQMIAMLILPRFVKKRDVRSTLVISSVVMILCNSMAFLSRGALTIVICRALAGVAYAGFKQVSNYLITRGYNTDAGRSENISQDNAGLLAGATCGAGLGAILSANLGYSMNFLISAGVFLIYMLVCFFALPWSMLKSRTDRDEEAKPISPQGIRRMIFSREMLFFILMIGIPLNIGVMLCVTLIPAICQTNGISSLMLSYCYIANGIAGIYIGPALVAKAKKKFGIPLSIAFAFILTAVSLFILHIPPVMVMIVIGSMILGFLDGFGTPMVTDQFMELKVVKNEVDESTALIFSVVLSYILLTFAPMIAELMLLPGRGFLTPMMIGAVIYGICAVALVLFKLGNRKEEKAHE